MKLSIIICTYNRADYIKKAILSIFNQEKIAIDYELIIVNNNSTDNTEEIINNFKQKHPTFPLKYFIESNQGLSFARNRGIKEATGEIVSFIDDDAIAYPDFIFELKSAFDRNPEFNALGGKILPIYEIGEEPKWMSKYIERIVSKVDFGNSEGAFPHKYPVGCNMAFRKEIFNKIGWFNTNLNLRADDKFIFDKIKKAKLKVLYAPKVIVEHHIEKERTTKAAVIRISKLNGRSDRIRINTSKNKLEFFLHGFEHLVKLNASLIIFIFFSLKGNYIKGKYLVMIMFQTFIGYVFYQKVIEYKKK